MSTGRKPLLKSPLRKSHPASMPACSCKASAGGRGEPRVAAWSLLETRSRVRNRLGVKIGGHPIFAPSATEGRPQQQEAWRHVARTCRPGREPRHRNAGDATESAANKLPWKTSATAQQEPAFLSSGITGRKAHVMPHVSWEPESVSRWGSQGGIVIDGKVETSQI